MATADEIALLKEYAVDPLNSFPRDDTALSLVIDEEGSVNAAAARLWRGYAASLSGLVDVSESGSTRKMGSLYKNAMEVAASFHSDAVVVVGVRRGPRSTAIVRGDVAT